MTIYLESLIKNINIDKGRIINLLIEKGIINYKEVLSILLYNGTDEQLYNYVKYINILTKEDKRLVLDELIRRKSANNLLFYACEISDAPVEEIEKVLIEAKIPGSIRLFALKVKGANIPLLEKTIIETGNAQDIYFFAKDINTANIDNLTNAIIDTNDAKFIRLFAINVKGANIELLEEALVSTGNLDEYKKFLGYKNKIQEENFTKLYNSIKNNDINDLEVNKERYAYLFKEPSTKVKALVRKLDERGY